MIASVGPLAAPLVSRSSVDQRDQCDRRARVQRCLSRSGARRALVVSRSRNRSDRGPLRRRGSDRQCPRPTPSAPPIRADPRAPRRPQHRESAARPGRTGRDRRRGPTTDRSLNHAHRRCSHRDRCERGCGIAPSTHYLAKTRAVSVRRQRDLSKADLTDQPAHDLTVGLEVQRASSRAALITTEPRRSARRGNPRRNETGERARARRSSRQLQVHRGARSRHEARWRVHPRMRRQR